MAEVFDLSKRSLRLSSVKTRSWRALSPRDSANLITAMECYVGVIRSKMRSEDEGDSPRRA